MESGGMKLRVRAAGGGATLRVQVPPPASVYDLRNVLSQMIGVPADSIRLSLNKRDEIEGDAGAPLAAYGVRSGDLLFYFDRDLGFETASSTAGTGEGVGSSRTATGAATSAENREVTGASSSSFAQNRKPDPATHRRELCAAAADRRARAVEQKGVHAEPSSATRTENAASIDQDIVQEAEEHDIVQEAEEHDIVQEAEEHGVDTKQFTCLIPNLLFRLLCMERSHLENSQDFLVLAVHAVMLETGFSVVGSPDNRLSWASLGSLKYTMPELENQDVNVILRCQKLGDFVIVYGTVAGAPHIYRLSLSVSKFLIEASRQGESDMQVDRREDTQNLLSVYKDTFALWKEVKDNLTLRLLMLLCEMAGLPMPACFQLLPTELKMKILECLPATELAIISSVSSELRFLASNEDLWKAKYLKEFTWKEGDAPPTSWKTLFVREWYARKRRQRAQTSARRDLVVPHHFRRPPVGAPHHPWGIIGGDYDIFPNAPFGPGRGGINPFGGGPRFRRPLNPGNFGPVSSTIVSLGDDEEAGPPGLRLPRPGQGERFQFGFHRTDPDPGDFI